MLGMAGLLPSQRAVAAEYTADARVEKLESIWAACGETAAMSAADWHFFKVRPGNHPVRRLAAMSYLLLRYRQEGLLAGLKSILLKTATDKAGHALEESLLVNPDRFWGRHMNSDLGGAVPALLGRERAAEIIVNVLLPFTAAGGFSGAPPGSRQKP